MDVFIHSFKCK